MEEGRELTCPGMESVFFSEFPEVCMAVRGAGQEWVISWWGKTKQLYFGALRKSNTFLALNIEGPFINPYWLSWPNCFQGNLNSFAPFPWPTPVLEAYLWHAWPSNIHLHSTSDRELTNAGSSLSHVDTAWSHYSSWSWAKCPSPRSFCLRTVLWNCPEHVPSSFAWQTFSCWKTVTLSPAVAFSLVWDMCSWFVHSLVTFNFSSNAWVLHSVNYLRCSQEGLLIAWGSSNSWYPGSGVICQLKGGPHYHYPHSGYSDTHFSGGSLTVTRLGTCCFSHAKKRQPRRILSHS